MTFKKRDLVVVIAMLLFATPAIGRPKSTADATAEQQATSAAQKHMDEGAALYAKADWAGAHVAFLKAWEIVQHRAIATNLADVELRLGLYVQASERLKYLISTLPGDHQEESSTLEAQLAECRLHATSLRVTSDIADATVRINGKDMGKVSSLGELIVEPGPAVVVLSRPGYQDAQRNLYLASGESRTLEFDLQPVATAPVSKPPAPAPRSTLPPPLPERSSFGAREIVTLSGLALTAAAGAVGIVYWRKSEATYDHALDIKAAAGIRSDECYPGKEIDVGACNDLYSTVRRGEREVDIMRGAYVTAGVLGVATVVTYLVWPRKATRTNKAFAPWSTIGGGGLTVSGQF